MSNEIEVDIHTKFGTSFQQAPLKRHSSPPFLSRAEAQFLLYYAVFWNVQTTFYCRLRGSQPAQTKLQCVTQKWVPQPPVWVWVSVVHALKVHKVRPLEQKKGGGWEPLSSPPARLGWDRTQRKESYYASTLGKGRKEGKKEKNKNSLQGKVVQVTHRFIL